MSNQNRELHWFNQLPEEEPSPDKARDTERNEQVKNNLRKYAVNAYQWIEEVSVFMKAEENKHLAWNALRGVLHAIRDRLTPEEVFQLSAQLPMLIRGLYIEGYQISNKPEKYHVDELENRIEKAFGPTQDVDVQQVFKAVLLVLHDHISEGELNDVYGNMPKDIRKLWDESLKAYTI